MFDQARRRGYTESQEISKYVSDVYIFLTYLLKSYFGGIYIQMHYPVLDFTGPHVLLMGSIISTILTISGPFNTIWGVLSASGFGILISGYIEELAHDKPELIVCATISTFVIFCTASVCARLFPNRNMVRIIGTTLACIELGILSLILSRVYDYDAAATTRLYLGVCCSAFYVYYDTLNMYERAESFVKVSYEHNVVNRQSSIVLDSFALFLDIIKLFTNILRVMERNDNKKRSK